MAYLYHELANDFVRRIEQGLYQPGERLPGVRVTSGNEGVSAATAVAAYRHLELEGYIESRPRSGFFVRPRPQTQLAEPEPSKPAARPKPVTGQQWVLQLAQNAADPRVVRLGATIPDAAFLPTTAITRALSAAAHRHRVQVSAYEFPPGLPALRQQIARRMAEAGCVMHPDDIVITVGCQEALYLSLKTVTRPGDVVAIESPTYYGLLQTLEALGLKAVEIPTHPREGISIEALQLALEQWPIKACVVIPNFNNPLGSLMPEKRKRALVRLINRFRGVTLIEDDIYGDLYFEGRRPSLLKTLDSKGNIIHCSSFSKTLATGLRIGWAASKQHREQLEYEKFVTNCATPTVTQLAVADLLASGRYERHVRGMRVALAQAVNRMIDRVSRNFPPQTKITRPTGGFAIWLELPKSVDATELAHKALEQGISIAAGPLFSPTKKYRHCIRLSCAIAWSDQVEQALLRLGELVKREM